MTHHIISGRPDDATTREVDPEVLIDIAIAAGREIMEVYAQAHHRIEQKSDGSPVTEADRRAESVILAALGARYPAIPVVSEEAAIGGVHHAGDAFFLVDPLDGSREFLNRNDEFTVNIALVEDGRPVVGIVYAPALHELYVGSPAGAWCARVVGDDVVSRRTIAVGRPKGPMRVVASRSHCSTETIAWINQFHGAAMVSRGSSLKFCLLACGEADVYPRFGRTMEWDTAAGEAVLRAAGGAVRTLDGDDLRYGKTCQDHDTDFANPFFIAIADPRLFLLPKAA